MNRSVYRSADGTTIVLEVPEPPMGSGSGYIPPPIIEFYKSPAPVLFVYAGEER